MSAVLYPSSNVFSTAFSIASASADKSNEYLNIIAAESIVAIGFATFCPAISGADPWLGSYSPFFPSPRLADASIPIKYPQTYFQ